MLNNAAKYEVEKNGSKYWVKDPFTNSYLVTRAYCKTFNCMASKVLEFDLLTDDQAHCSKLNNLRTEP